MKLVVNLLADTEEVRLANYMFHSITELLYLINLIHK